MSQKLRDLGVSDLLASTRRVLKKYPENIELVLSWNDHKNSLELERVECNDEGDAKNILLDVVEYKPICNTVLTFGVELLKRYPNVEIHLEAGMMDIYFPFKEDE